MKRISAAVLALLLALSFIWASAENLSELLASTENRSVGNETAVYDAMYAVLNKANGESLPLEDWSKVTTYLSKLIVREPLDTEEMIFDQSISAYEKFFLLTLNGTTLSDETAAELIALFEKALEDFPADGSNLYISENSDAFLIGFMRQALELLDWTCVPDAIEDSLTLYEIRDNEGNTVISAHDALTTLPGAILMKHVPVEKREASAEVLAYIVSNAPDAVNWTLVAGGNDAFFEEFVGEQAQDTANEADLQAMTDKWLNLLFACDAFDAEMRTQTEGNGLQRVREALAAMSERAVETLEEKGQGLSLQFTDMPSDLEPTATPAVQETLEPAQTATAAPSTSAISVDASYAYSYVIYVSKNSHTIAILGRDANGEFSRTLRTFSTGIGKAGQTRAGTYTIQKKERWHSWSGGTYSPYSSRHSSGAYIHGPIYTAKNSNSMQPGSYNEIGTNCSSGCLRTTCSAAAWVYYNCPVGTLIIVANDSRYSASRPASIPSGQRYDPTDPGATPEIPVTEFAISPSELTLKPGETATLTLTSIKPSNNSTEGFKYASSNSDIAKVSANGVVTAVAPGTAKITVTADDINSCARSVVVTVVDPSATETPAPTETPMPTETIDPEQTPEPTETLDPTETEAPADSPSPAETEVPGETLAPEETAAPAETETPDTTPDPADTAAPTEGPESTEGPENTELPEATETPNPLESVNPTESPAATEVPAGNK